MVFCKFNKLEPCHEIFTRILRPSSYCLYRFLTTFLEVFGRERKFKEHGPKEDHQKSDTKKSTEKSTAVKETSDVMTTFFLAQIFVY